MLIYKCSVTRGILKGKGIDSVEGVERKKKKGAGSVRFEYFRDIKRCS